MLPMDVYVGELYQYRYGKDVIDENNRVVDVTVVEDDLSIVIVMEESNSVVDNVYTFDVRLYMIDISDATLGIYVLSDYKYMYIQFNIQYIGSSYDIKGCTALDGSTCVNENKIVTKTLIFDFKSIPNDVIPNIQSIDFDAITVGKGSIRGDYSNDGYFLIGASDNAEEQDTYFVFLCYEPVKFDIIDYNILPANATSIVGVNTSI